MRPAAPLDPRLSLRAPRHTEDTGGPPLAASAAATSRYDTERRRTAGLAAWECTACRRNPYGLTFRELTVLNHVAAGKRNKEIARELGISPLTIDKHVANILGKIKATSRTDAGVRAVRERLIE